MSRARILADYVSSGDELADKAPLASPAFTGTPTGITATHVGLGNVTNESKATMLTSPTLTGTTTVSGDLVPSTPLSHRNMIINGAFQVWQRASATTTVAFTYGTADRWGHHYSFNGSYTSGRHSMSLAELNTTGHAYALKLVCTGADTSIGAGQYNFLKYRIEAQDCQHLLYGTANAKTITISFWVKSDKTGTYCLTVKKADTTAYQCPNSFTIDVADTWEKKVITIPPTAGSTSLITGAGGIIANDTGIGLDIIFSLVAGTDYQGTNAIWSTNSHFAVSGQVNWANETNDFYLTGVQLELGSNATPFEHRSYGEELARCQRYCIVLDQNARCFPGRCFGGATVDASIPVFPVEMRDTPTHVQQGTAAIANFFMSDGSSDTATINSVDIVHASKTGCMIRYATGGGITNGPVTTQSAYNSWEFNAELG